MDRRKRKQKKQTKEQYTNYDAQVVEKQLTSV